MKHLLISTTIALTQCFVLLGQIPVVDATSILTQTMTDYDIVMTADLSLESSERLNSVLRGLSEKFFGNGVEDKAVLAADLLSLTSEIATYSSRILQAEAIVKDYSKKFSGIRTGSDAASYLSGAVFTVQDYYNYSDKLYAAVKDIVSSRYRTISQKQDAIEKARRELSDRGLFVLDSVSTRIERMETARSLADWVRSVSVSLDAESYSSEQQKIYGKSLKGNGGTIGVIILSLILLACCAEAVFSIGKFYSGEYAFDALIKRILLAIVGALITLSAVIPLI